VVKRSAKSCRQKVIFSQVNKLPEKRAFGQQVMHALAEKIWSSAQEQLRSILTADIYNLWFAPLRCDQLTATPSSSKLPTIFGTVAQTTI
jgi:hypothetical protein